MVKKALYATILKSLISSGILSVPESMEDSLLKVEDSDGDYTVVSTGKEVLRSPSNNVTPKVSRLEEKAIILPQYDLFSAKSSAWSRMEARLRVRLACLQLAKGS